MKKATREGGPMMYAGDMGAWVHRLSQIDGENKRAICEHCGPVPVRFKKGGKGKPLKIICENRFQANVSSGAALLRERRFPHLKHIADTCTRCGFVAEHLCQMDAIYRDGNKKNTAPENFQTLCANCNRLLRHQAGQAVSHF